VPVRHGHGIGDNSLFETARRCCTYRLWCGSVLLQLSQPAAWLIAVGIVAGLAGSIATATVIRKLPFGTEPWDAFTLAGVALVRGTSALAVGYLPARRAASRESRRGPPCRKTTSGSTDSRDAAGAGVSPH
jgi:hypothetical protein